MFVKITNGQAQANYTIGDLRRDNPNISFPKNISDETLERFNVYRVKEIPAPEYNQRTHRLVTQAPQLIDEVWTISRLPVQKEQEQIDKETKRVALDVRLTRDRKLAETDWLVVKHLELNQNIPAAWEIYRQSLRDIPQQPGFPWEVTWPDKPV